jgi:hypothetical protein
MEAARRRLTGSRPEKSIDLDRLHEGIDIVDRS